MDIKISRIVVPLFLFISIVSCKNEIGEKLHKSNINDTIYSEATVDTSASRTKETLLQKVDGAIWSMGNIEEYIQNKLSKASNKNQGNEIYEEYRENIERHIEFINELEGNLLANYAGYYETEKDQFIFPDSIQKHIDLFKNTDLEFWELGEGYTEIRFKANHYYNMFRGKVTADYDYYLKTEAKENSVLYSADAGLLISFEELGNRIQNWEKFRTDYPKSPLLERATQRYQEYGYIYLLGIDNTPTFDYDDRSLYNENKKEFKRFIAQNPNTDFTQIIKRFLAKIELKPTDEDLEEFVQKELNIVVEKEPDTP